MWTWYVGPKSKCVARCDLRHLLPRRVTVTKATVGRAAMVGMMERVTGKAMAMERAMAMARGMAMARAMATERAMVTERAMAMARAMVAGRCKAELFLAVQKKRDVCTQCLDRDKKIHNWSYVLGCNILAVVVLNMSTLACRAASTKIGATGEAKQKGTGSENLSQHDKALAEHTFCNSFAAQLFWLSGVLRTSLGRVRTSVLFSETFGVFPNVSF